MQKNSCEGCPICCRDKSLSLAFTSLREFAKVESLHVCLTPVQQLGPSCGIAALASALSAPMLHKSSSYVVTFSDLLSAAKDNFWSLAGEMFDAANVAQLAMNAHPNVVAEVAVLADDLRGARNTLLMHLTHGHPVLIAYDCDADYFPKKALGHKAHWAVLNGYCLGTGKVVREMQNLVNLYPDDPGAIELSERACSTCEDAVFFWTLQGKSRLFRTFEACTLLSSNFQLLEADPLLLAKDYRIPQNGNISESLSHRAVVLSAKI